MDEELAREAARFWASRRRKVRGACRECGQEFEGTTRRMYCSNRCAVRAYRRRQKEGKKGQEGGQASS